MIYISTSVMNVAIASGDDDDDDDDSGENPAAITNSQPRGGFTKTRNPGYPDISPTSFDSCPSDTHRTHLMEADTREDNK